MTGGQDNLTAPSPDEMPPEEKPQDTVPSERASLIDVFENFLGASISSITDQNLESLSLSQADGLVEQIDIFLVLLQRLIRSS